MRELTDRYLSSLQKSLSGLYEIYIFNAGRIFVNKIGGELSAVYRQKLKTTLIGIRSSISDGFIAMVSQIVSLLYACNLIMNGTITVGSYVAISIYLRYFGSSLQSIVSVNLKFKSVLVSFERLLSIYDSFLEKPVRYERLDRDDVAIEISNCRFAYDGKKPVLDGISLTIPTRGIIGIVGANGSGKTTLLKVIFGMLEAQGRLSFSRDIMGKAGRIRNAIAYVQQDPFFFNCSIKENLRIACEDASDEDIRNACRKAFADEFIDSLVRGYDTAIGDKGNQLSGGEKQRLAIARAILRGCKVLLLDEVTSNLDGKSEYDLMSVLHELSATTSIVIVSHRLSTVIGLERIIVMDKGAILAQGRHEELLDTYEAYRDLFLPQWEEYLENMKKNGIPEEVLL